MNTNDKMTVIESRDVAPQWVGGKGGNLGDFTLSTKGFTGQGLIAMATKDAKFADAMADILNNQLHIQFGSKLCKQLVTPGLEKQGKEEKWPEYAERTYEKAKELAAAKLPSATLDYVAAFEDWAVNVFPKRGQRMDKRPFLTDYDKVVSGVETHWSGMDAERRAKLVERLALGEIPADAKASDVVAAINAKYQRPVTVDAGDLFGE